MEKIITGAITAEDKAMAEFCMEAILKHGAGQARVTLSKSVVDSIGTLDGQIDKVSHSSDQSLFMAIFADGKYGTFSTNILDKKELLQFTEKAVKMVKLLEEDPLRALPDPELTAKDAVTGRELGLFDDTYAGMDSEKRLEIAMNESIFSRETTPAYRVLSEECEYSDSIEDSYIIDSQDFAGRHTETSFAVCAENTIEDKSGKKYSGYMWDSSPFLAGLSLKSCSDAALSKAAKQIGPRKHRGGRFTAVIDKMVSSRLVSPLLSALNALAIQQKSSFLENSIDRKIFHDSLTVIDLARTPGRAGSRLFDSEGVATKEMPIIENGIVRNYFTNTYMAAKTGLPQTIEGASRPVLMPKNTPADAIPAIANPIPADANTILHSIGQGIYITGFNGGNCNPVTGDFSYGVEGFAFRDGEILYPVREMLVTGNMIELWNRLIAIGQDARRCTKWQIPSLAFENVDFSG